MAIYKNAVIGWVVSAFQEVGLRTYVTAHPLDVSVEGLLGSAGIDGIHQDAKIIAAIPATPGIFRVYGILPDGDSVPLGYEFPGIEVNWEWLYSETLKDWDKQYSEANSGRKEVNQ